MNYAVKVLITAAMVVLVSEAAKRNVVAGALPLCVVQSQGLFH